MTADDLRLQAPLRRRRIGLILLAAATVLLTGQGFIEWLLPYDMAALAGVRRVLEMPWLQPQALALAWGIASTAALALLWRAQPAWAMTTVLALLTGVLLGTARAAAGGAIGALLLLATAGVASLGWQSRRQGGLPLLLAAAAAIAGWDALLSSHATLWPVCVAVVAVFVWIERQHIQANDRRLLSALVERDGLIDELQRKRAELLRLQQARTQMLAGIAHDLRQPLWAVRLCADALLHREPVPEDADLLRQQMDAIEDASALLDQFSDLAAIERGALTLRPEPVNVRELLASVAAGLKTAHLQRGASLSVHGREVWLRTDRLHLARVLQNLAGNAVRHSNAAHGRQGARVLLAVRPHAGGWAIDVVDNGNGIPADKLSEVFEPYVQLEPGKSGRQGLGLAIVRGLVGTLGMELDVRSAHGHGSRFRVVVPAALHAEAPAPAPARTAEFSR